METLENKDRIVQILGNFGVGIQSITEYRGNALTLYEVKPQDGIRISKIRNLKDEIAVSLGVRSVRIIAPTENGNVGIEVPNKERTTVTCGEIFNSWVFQNTDMELPIALGKTATGEIFMADLAEMPHLLVAGATGQGKSVCLNMILMSLLRKKSPDDIHLVLIDPKKVEFDIYSKLLGTYLGAPEIITETDKAEKALEDTCRIMDDRYRILAKAGVRNIKEYNVLHPDNKMQYGIIIIDEYGDLIMTGGKTMEQYICRIAQKARAVGLHMIVSTQRPSATIVTGNIKANFPTRIAFRTTTGTDSRVIIDQMGAEKLTGKGDMLFFCGSEVTRIQGAYVSIGEVSSELDRIASEYADYVDAYCEELKRQEYDNANQSGIEEREEALAIEGMRKERKEKSEQWLEFIRRKMREKYGAD